MKNKIAFLSIFAILNLLFSVCKSEYTSRQNNLPKLPSIVQSNYKHYIYKNRKKYLFASIDNAEFFEKSKTINCDRIYAEIYDSKEKLTTKIKSDKAVINNGDKKLTFSENVELEIVDKETTLYTDGLELDYEKNRLKSDGNIVMKKKDGSYVKADSMESDVNLEVTNFKNMEIKYYYDEDKKK